MPTVTPAAVLPPLAEWVTSPDMRLVAVAFLLERRYSPAALEIVRDAARAAATDCQGSEGSEGDASDGGIGRSAAGAPLVVPAHLALAALASEHPDCAAVAAVLQHSNLTRDHWEQLLKGVALGQGCTPGERGQAPGDLFSPSAQHLLFQSYRWAVWDGKCNAA
ncbi:hypothetical protein GPECTOR_14g110 [Gonium pectorale]|uniref:Uncharacterized protein n=1 Tax=Gonium pectorale TaxID=33097 RepID=A0A150GLX5_GONPE|nr:hypothetical protein GPECTOR_14g110 [Gonium pectorale]|eukprot:KXZ50859.1 hypothetical protein GPECTOR_14g110 [Gonium pectorale]